MRNPRGKRSWPNFFSNEYLKVKLIILNLLRTLRWHIEQSCLAKKKKSRSHWVNKDIVASFMMVKEFWELFKLIPCVDPDPLMNLWDLFVYHVFGILRDNIHDTGEYMKHHFFELQRKIRRHQWSLQLYAQWYSALPVEHCKLVLQRSWVWILFRCEYFSGFNFTAALIVHRTVMINDVLIFMIL